MADKPISDLADALAEFLLLIPRVVLNLTDADLKDPDTIYELAAAVEGTTYPTVLAVLETHIVDEYLLPDDGGPVSNVDMNVGPAAAGAANHWDIGSISAGAATGENKTAWTFGGGLSRDTSILKGEALVAQSGFAGQGPFTGGNPANWAKLTVFYAVVTDS